MAGLVPMSIGDILLAAGTYWLSPVLQSGIIDTKVKTMAVVEWSLKLTLPIVRLIMECVKRNLPARDMEYQAVP